MRYPNIKPETPEECESCGSNEATLERFESYGPGPQVSWLCPYCSRCHYKTYPMLSGVAGMLNHFEARIKALLQEQS